MTDCTTTASQPEGSEALEKDVTTAEGQEMMEDGGTVKEATVKDKDTEEKEKDQTEEITQAQDNSSGSNSMVEEGNEHKEAPSNTEESSKTDEESSDMTNKDKEIGAAKRKASEESNENSEKENAEEGDADNKSTAAPSSGTTPNPPRPIKKARSAYMIFTSDKRPEIQATHPGESMGSIAKLLGQRWNSLSEEDKQKYQLKAAEERERVAKDLENWKQVTGLDALPPVEGAGTAALSPTATVLPVARMRKIIRLDPEVKGVSKEATALITKCAELAAVKLGQEAVLVAQVQNRRKLIAADVAQVASTREQFLFLQDDVKDLVREQLQQAGTSTAAKKASSDNANPAPGSKTLTDFFGNKVEKQSTQDSQ